MATSKIGAGIGVDTRDLRQFIRACRKASPTAALGIRKALLASGEIVAAEARAIAGQYSTKAPSTVKARVRGATVSVVAGGAGAPVVAPWEMGNRGRSQSDTFRHPVFGDREHWVEQPRHPILRPAARAKGAEMQAEVLKVADQVADVLTDRTVI